MKHNIVNERTVEEHMKIVDVEILLTEEEIAKMDKGNMVFNFGVGKRVGKITVQKETK